MRCKTETNHYAVRMPTLMFAPLLAFAETGRAKVDLFAPWSSTFDANGMCLGESRSDRQEGVRGEASVGTEGHIDGRTHTIKKAEVAVVC